MSNNPAMQGAVEAQVDIPKSTQGIFDLPCGYLAANNELLSEVKVREITGVEEDMLAARNISGGKKITQLLANCLERIGPITDKAQLVQIARDLVIGDRVFLMMAVRRVTLGDEFPFEHKCPECSATQFYTVSLAELDIKRMPDPRKRAYECVLPSGKMARFHVMTGKEEELLSKNTNNVVDNLSMSILVRLDQLGSEPASLETVKGLGLRDRTALRDEFERVEGGVDTSITLDCPKCGSTFDAELDVGQTGFFFPSRVRKN